MGAEQSDLAKAPQAEPQGGAAADSAAAAPSEATATRLYKFSDGAWGLHAASVTPHFFNAQEDAASSGAQWGVEAGDFEMAVSDQYSADDAGLRATFASEAGIWALRFPSAPAYRAFMDAYNAKLFENTYGLPLNEANKQKVFGKDSVLTLGVKETAESRQAWAEDVNMEEKPAKGEQFRDRAVAKKDAIHGVRMGAGEYSFLVREGQVEALRNVHNGVQVMEGRTFSVTPPGRAQKAFTPSKTLLMQRERRMGMLTPSKASAVYDTDIETGKVVSEWQFRKDGAEVGMKDIVNEARAAQLDDRSTFLGIDSSRLVRWDMRDPGGVVSELGSPSVVSYAGGKDYASKPKFSCIATSGDGYVVIGSEDGQVRLYSDRSLTRANTAIQGLGAPITAVDVTYDGNWVLATTNRYLMVVKTTYRDKKGASTNGFRSRMGAAAPAPRLLRLKAEDIQVTGGAPLALGKFTWVTEAGRQERWVVATCGKYTVLWNFRQVKLASEETASSHGGLTTITSYHLIPKQDSVVDSVFMADSHTSPAAGPQGDASMVILTKHEIFSLGGEDSD